MSKKNNQLRFLRPSDKGVMIATPVPRDCSINIHTANWCSQQCKREWVGWLHEPGYVAEDSRNLLVANILDFHKEVTHVLFVDADTVPMGMDMLDALLKRDKLIVSGVYPMFVGGKKKWSYSVDYENGVHKLADFAKLPRNIFQAGRVGGGMLLIKREVLEAIEYPWFETQRTRTGITMGHDFNFCAKAAGHGFEIWVDPSVICRHQNTQELMEIFNVEERK